VAPPNATVDIGGKQTYVATGHYSDGTSHDISTSVTWSPGTPSVAMVGLTGQATGLAQGTSHIIATLGALSAYGILNVNAAPTPPAPGTCLSGPLDLGRAASFAVLGGPALSVTNPTPVTGDVGALSITPSVGPLPLTGNLYDATGGGPTAIANAVTDMRAAIACALSRPCDFNYTVVTDFSAVNAATPGGLVPGVYCVAAAMNVSSPVILTLVNPGVYIFRSTGALTSAPGVTVNLGGTANAGNTSIFWISTGAASGASIGATNVFLGTIMVDPGAATLGANTTLLGGRVLSSSAATLDKNAITIP
jgi:trimeric autotransporter adhesin